MNEPAHILVVDDDVSIRRIFHKMLVKSGYRVSLAGSGEEALAYLNLITPDLIILDLTLPGIDGHAVVRQIKADQSKPFTPIIMVSARSDLATSVSSLDAGADDFLVKPVEFEDLKARVRAMLRLQRTQRSLRNEQRKTELLLHLTRELGASIDLDALLTRFLDHLADAVGAVRASIILTGYDEQTLCYSSSRDKTASLLTDVLRRGVACWVLREGSSLIISDTQQDVRWISAEGDDLNVRSVAATPVARETRTLGVITLVHHTPNYFTDEHIDLLTSVAAQAAVALESAWLFSLTQRQTELLSRRAEDLRKINEINAHLSELMYPDQLVRLTAYMVQQQMGYPLVSVLLREGDELVLHTAAGSLGNETPYDIRFPSDQGLNGWAIQQRQIVRVDDVRADDRFGVLLPDDELVRSEMVVPILLRSEVFGTLDVRSPEPTAFSRNDEAVLSAIVSQLSVALGNALLLENEQRRIRQLSQVNRLSVDITAQLDPNQSLQLAADAVAKIFGVHQASILLLSDTGDLDDALVAIHGTPTPADEDLIRLVHGSSEFQALVKRLRGPMVVRDFQRDPRVAPLQRLLRMRQIDALLAVPMVAGGATIGVLAIDATNREKGYGRADLELATTVASLIIQVIENARLYRAVEDERSTLNAVLRGAADPIMLIGPENELLLANRAAEECLHLRLEEARGRSLHTLRNGSENPFLDYLLPLLETAHNGNSHNGSTELALPQDVTYSISIAPVHSADDQPLGRVAVLQDITAIKLLERQERERMRSVFRRYVSPPVAERLLNAGQELGQPTESDVVVVIADMRGFTSLTERTDPKVLIERILNRYFTAMTEVLYSYEGTIDKFLGDGIIGVFGTPIARPDDPQRALLSAVDMQRAFAALSDTWRSELDLEIGMGIGISYGRAVVGNIGSEQRLDYTLIGDVVNTASRLSGEAKAGQIIVSYHLRDVLPPEDAALCKLKALGEVKLKGKQELHLIYDVCY